VGLTLLVTCFGAMSSCFRGRRPFIGKGFVRTLRIARGGRGS
jgi:hypothetical protein